MIVNGVKAHNFMRYGDFQLDGFPEKGLIGIFGENESGKSTIGELICFCLFGRTPRAPEGEPEKLIRWGEDTCSAELIFTVVDKKFRVNRMLTRDGGSDGGLVAVDSSDIYASNAQQIEGAVTDLLGYGFKEFRYSTFIAQNELDIILHSSEDRKLVLNNMLGVGFMENMAQRVSDRRYGYEAELKQLRSRAADKYEVLNVYAARERDMERVRQRMDSVSKKLLERLKEHDHVQSTISLLSEISRKTEQYEVLDARIKSRRERLQKIEVQCSELMREVDRIPEIEKAIEEKKNSIYEIQHSRQARIDEQFKKLDEYRDRRDELDRINSNIDLKNAALGEITAKLRQIEEKENLIQEFTVEHATLDYFIKAYSGSDRFKTAATHLIKDMELLHSEIDKVRTTHRKDLEIFREREKAFVEQQSRIKKQISASTIQEVDPGRLADLKKKANSNTKLRDLGLMAGILFLAAGVGLTVALGSVTYLAVLAGMIPSCGVSLLLQNKIRALRDDIQELQQQSYAYSITQRGIAELQDSTEDVQQHLAAIHDEIAQKEKMGPVLSKIKVNNFVDLENNIEMLEEISFRELERTRSMMKDMLHSYTDLRKLVGDDSIPFGHIISFDLDEFMNRKSERRDRLEEDLDRLKSELHGKEELVRQSETLLESIARMRQNAESVVEAIDALGVTEEDEPELKRQEQQLSVDLERLQREIDECRAEIRTIEARQDEAAELEDSRRAIIDEIDKDLIKLYELRETTVDIDCSPERFRELQRQLESLELLIQEAREELKEVEGEMKVVRKDLDRMPAVQEEIDKLEQNAEYTETYMLKLKELENLFLQTGANIRRRLLPQIEAYFSWVLPRMTRGRYHKVRLDEDFEIKVFSDEYGDYVSLDTLSGGTIDQLLISLRLAFAHATFANSGTSGQFLFLDEPFSSFDESRREQFFKLLQSLKSNFQQIFLISHLPNLEDFTDHYFRLDITKQELPASVSWTHS